MALLGATRALIQPYDGVGVVLTKPGGGWARRSFKDGQTDCLGLDVPCLNKMEVFVDGAVVKYAESRTLISLEDAGRLSKYLLRGTQNRPWKAEQIGFLYFNEPPAPLPAGAAQALSRFIFNPWRHSPPAREQHKSRSPRRAPPH